MPFVRNKRNANTDHELSRNGRFLTQDAMGGDAWTNNLYAYCHNNPVSFKDPTGYYEDATGDRETDLRLHNEKKKREHIINSAKKIMDNKVYSR